jgi:hypothetical protein
MSKLQEYKDNKRMKELGLPKIYVIKSSRTGVESPKERQICEIQDNYGTRTYMDGSKNLNKYITKDDFPYEMIIEEGEISGIEAGYGTGMGDLWAWSYYYTFSKDDAYDYFEKESIRVSEKYQKHNNMNEEQKIQETILSFFKRKAKQYGEHENNLFIEGGLTYLSLGVNSEFDSRILETRITDFIK